MIAVATQGWCTFPSRQVQLQLIYHTTRSRLMTVTHGDWVLGCPETLYVPEKL